MAEIIGFLVLIDRPETLLTTTNIYEVRGGGWNSSWRREIEATKPNIWNVICQLRHRQLPS